MKISNSELKAILAEVEAELEPLLRSERERLSKAVGDEMSASAGSPMGEEASKSPGRDMLPEERSGGEESAGSPMGSPAGSPPPGAEGSAGGEGGEAGGEVEALAAEYAKLPPEELEMHLMALQAAMQQLGGGAEGSPAGSPPPAGPEASAGSPAMKKEMSASPEASKAKKAEKSPKPEKSMEKSYAKKEKSGEESEESEKSSPMSKSEFDALNTKVDMALKAVEFLTRPMRKAVTEFGETPAKVWSRGEVTTKLKEVTSSPSLAKSDRELINGFYDGRVSLDKIAHLLK